MRYVLKLDCYAGISGDMLSSALHDLVIENGKKPVDVDALTSHIKKNVANVEKLEINFKHVMKSGFKAMYMDIALEESRDAHQGHIHALQKELENCITFLATERAKSYTRRVLEKIFNAEKHAHGLDTHSHHGRDKNHHSEIHLHELNSADTLLDVLVVAKNLEILGFFDESNDFTVYSSPVTTGRGTVRTAHGLVPIPAPGTLEILQSHEIPNNDGLIDGLEMATPTGVALLAALDPEFSPLGIPAKILSKGVGAGTKSIPGLANILRVQLLEINKSISRDGTMIGEYIASTPFKPVTDTIIQITMAIDDATPEDIGHLVESSYSNGAVEIYTIPVYMKKSRVGLEVKILCDKIVLSKLLTIWLDTGTTLGCRIEEIERVVLKRLNQTHQIIFSPDEMQYKVDKAIKISVRVKRVVIREDFSTNDWSVNFKRPLFKIEHDDLRKAAKILDLPLNLTRELIKKKIVESID